MMKDTLTAIGLNHDEIKIYFELLESGMATAGEIAKRTGMVRPSVYNFLQKMTDKGVVMRSLKQGVRSFTALPPEDLLKLFDLKISEIKSKQEEYKNYIPELINKYGGKISAPRIQIFEGNDTRNIFNDLLNYRDIDSFSFWPTQHMLTGLGDDYWMFNNRERIKNNMRIFAIRCENNNVVTKAAPYTAACRELLREVRIAPKEMEFTMGYWIYGNKAAMLSSAKERIAFIIESAELIEMLKVQWRFIWDRSTPYKSDPKDYRHVLKDLL